MSNTVLRIDSSANRTSSQTRAMTDRIIEHLAPSQVITRDLDADALPQIDQAWTEARLVPEGDRTDSQRQVLGLSDALIGELQQADTLVMGVPLYNFSVPATVKLWIDLIARPKVTFAYTETGPKGLLTGKRAIVAMSSGGVPIGAPADFASPYLRHVLGFIGITDVTLATKDNLDDVLAQHSTASAA